MEEIIYGVDTSKKITNTMARDAMVKCFIEAHEKSIDIEGLDKEDRKKMILDIIYNAFKETGGEYDKPTKATLNKVVVYLREFSMPFRDTETIEKHFNAIKYLIDHSEEA